MNDYLGEVVLKSGERVQAVVICGPDSQWRGRITALLAHKEELWRWQVAQLLGDAQQTGVEARFYLLHRDGVPFSNIMTVDRGGVGLLGHVWTRPEDRRQGAASALMKQTMGHFHRRGGQALYLGTGFDTAPFHLYRKFKFEPLNARSGIMRFFTRSLAGFEADYFAPGDTEIVPFGWAQWAVSSVLLAGDFPGVLRNVPCDLLGRVLTEGHLLPLVREEAGRAVGDSSRAQVLQKTSNGALVGFASWDFDPSWPDTCRVDVWCHPRFWERAAELLRSLKLPDARRTLAWSDALCEQKADVLRSAGFRALAFLPRWVADANNSEWVDVILWEKRP